MSASNHPLAPQSTFPKREASSARSAGRRISYLAATAAAIFLPQTGSGYIWDVTPGDGSVITAGSGLWTDGGANWNTGTGDVIWATGNTANFNGPDGAYNITVGSGISTTSLNFNGSGYILNSVEPTVLTATQIQVASGKTATIGSNLTVTRAAAMTISGGGLLNVFGRVQSTGNSNLTIQGGTTLDVKAGGNLNAGASLVVGASGAPGSNGTLLVSGGTVTTTNANPLSPNGNFVLGNTGGVDATVTITSGLIAIDPTSATGLRYGSTAVIADAVISGTFNLDGGVVETRKVGEGAAPIGTGSLTSTFNFNGGVLKANAAPPSGSSFMGGLDFANVKAGGASIDSNKIANITVSQVLAHDAGLGATPDGGLTKLGEGILTLSGANTYTGATVVETGAIQIANANALGDIAGDTTVNSGAALRISGGITTGAETLSVSGTGVDNDGVIRNVSGNNTYSGPVTLTGASLITSDSGTLALNVAAGNAITADNQNVTFGGASSVTISDAISLGSGSLTKTGAGTLSMVASTYTGVTTISGGKISTSSLGMGGVASGIGSSSSASSNLVFDGGTLRFTGSVNTTTDRGFTLNAGGGTIEVAHTSVGAGLRFAGVITGSGDLTVTRGGSNTGLFFGLSAINTYTGKTFVTNGVALEYRRAEAAGATGSFANGTEITGATVRLDPGGSGGVAADTDFTEYFTLGAGGALTNDSFVNTVSGKIALTGNGTISTTSTAGNSLIVSGEIAAGDHVLTVSPTTVGGILIDGGISGSAQGSFTKAGAGTLVLAGEANTYLGNTIVTSGTMEVSGTISATSAVSITGGTLKLAGANRINDLAAVSMSGGTLDTAGFAENLGAFTLQGTAQIDLGTGSSVVRFLDSSSAAANWAGTLSISNWTGLLAGGGSDQLFFGSSFGGLTPEQVAMIAFVDPVGLEPGTYGAQMLPTGEIVAVPEPGTAAALMGAIGVLALGRFRRRSQV